MRFVYIFRFFKKGRQPKEPNLIDRRPIWIILALLIVAGYLIFIFSRSVWRNFEINRELLNLDEETEELKVKQEYLTNLIAYYKTKSFAEKEARSKLGLKKEGETVLPLPRRASLEKKEEKLENTPQVREKTNLERWWKFFFKN